MFCSPVPNRNFFRLCSVGCPVLVSKSSLFLGKIFRLHTVAKFTSAVMHRLNNRQANSYEPGSFSDLLCSSTRFVLNKYLVPFEAHLLISGHAFHTHTVNLSGYRLLSYPHTQCYSASPTKDLHAYCHRWTPWQTVYQPTLQLLHTLEAQEGTAGQP